MLEISIVINLILVLVLIHAYEPQIKSYFKKKEDKIRSEVLNPAAGTCPFCKQVFVGKVMYSQSGHLCCQNCLITVFNNK